MGRILSMKIPEDLEPMRRTTLRTALAWTLQRRSHTVLVVLLCALAGISSALGLLRWQHPYARWSFAALCWCVAVIVMVTARNNIGDDQ